MSLAAYNRLKYGTKTSHWDKRFPLAKDKRSEQQKLDDKDAKALMTIGLKIRKSSPNLSDEEIAIKAKAWLEKQRAE